MTKIYFVLALFFSVTFAKAADDTTGLSCGMVPTLTQFLLRYHVTIHNANDDLYNKATDQMIKRLDPSKAFFLQSEVDELKPKLFKYLKSMKDKADCKDVDGIRDLLLNRAKEQLAYAKEALGPNYKLDENVELQLDPDKKTFAKNIEEAHKRQLVQIHFQISNFLIAFNEGVADVKTKGKKPQASLAPLPKDLAKAKTQLIHRYELSVKRMEELKKPRLSGRKTAGALSGKSEKV